MMTVDKAIEIVISLAKRQARGDKQAEAIAVIEDFFTNVVYK